MGCWECSAGWPGPALLGEPAHTHLPGWGYQPDLDWQRDGSWRAPLVFKMIETCLLQASVYQRVELWGVGLKLSGGPSSSPQRVHFLAHVGLTQTSLL